ncbi:MAG: hypothetical protein RR554_05315 [Vagococcus sp.]|uniref:pectate lyase-like adhesive domain-containing protein n=1 Tax=Vagococcus sp. TaxID=1933889 RepID=UPI002FC92A7F
MNRKCRNSLFSIAILFLGIIMYGTETEAMTASVNDWTDFRNAISNASVDKIVVNEPIFAGASLASVNREIEIDGQNNLIDFKGQALAFKAGGKITVSNFKFTGTGTIFTGTEGELILKNKIIADDKNTAGLANIGGKSLVKFDGADAKYSRGENTTAGITSKDFVVTNGTIIDSTAISLYESKVDGGTTTIDKGSKIEAKSFGPKDNKSGQVFKYNNVADIFIKDLGTEVNLSGNVFTDGNDGALFTIQKDNSSLNVLDGAKMNLLSERTTALVMYSRNGVFNVKNGSELNFTSNGNNNEYGGTIRFRVRGENTFNIEDNSKINILKTGKNNGNKNEILPPAIRMSGENNKVIVKNNSEFRVTNEGNVNGTDSNSGGNRGNQGLLYNKGAGNQFIVDGANSSVDIQAKHGAAIDAKSAGIDIQAGEDTYFVTRGTTSSTSDAIFSAGVMNINMYKPKYFDFSSKNSQVFDNSNGSKMKTEGSDLSVWKKGSDLQGNPFNSWSLIDYSLSGADYNTIDSSNDEDFLSTFNKMSDYSRITANNQSAKVTSIQVPTNADQYIYVNTSVPEGKYDEDRPAYDNEVGVRVGLYDEQGKEINQLTGRTTTEKIYDADDEKLGVVKIPLPKKEFFKPGMSVKVLSAWRGSGDENSDKAHMSHPEDITAKEVTAVDVTPPNQVTLDSKTISNSTTKLSGTSDQEGARIFLKNNGQWMKDEQDKILTTTVKNGKWSLTLPKVLSKNDVFEIYAKEDMAIDKAGITYQLPDTYTQEPNGVSGNLNVSAINYGQYPGYHDAMGDSRFDPSLKLSVLDAMPYTPKITKIARALTKDEKGNQIPQIEGDKPANPDEWQGTVTKVNNTLSYRIVVQIPGSIGEEQEKVMYNANVTDVIPKGLEFNKEDVKVWKYKKDDTDNLPFRYPSNQVGEDGKHQHNMGDIDLEKSEATEITDAIIKYQEDKRLLTVGIGDKTMTPKETEYVGNNEYGVLYPGEKIVIEVPTKVTAKAVKTEIHNKAIVTGNSSIIKTNEPLVYQEVTAESNDAVNPGGDIIGELLLVSAPKEITFAKTKLIDYNKTIGSDETSIDQPLVVKDTLKDKDWKITVNLTEEMTHEENGDVYELPNSLFVRYQNKNTMLMLNNPVDIYQSDITSVSKTKEEFNISDSWGKAENEDGLKMKASKIPQTGEYQGAVEWTLENTQ